MMITIHGLPPKTTFQAVKTLVKQECNIIDFILDNLVDDGPNSKKVRIGVSDDTEGYRIIKYLNGFRMSPTHLLKIVPVGKPLNPPPDLSYNQRPTYQSESQNDYQNQMQPRPDYHSPKDSYSGGNRPPPKDTRKGNFIPPNMRKKNLEPAQDHRNVGLPRHAELRPNLDSHHDRDPHGSSSHVSGSHGPGMHISGSGSHGMAPHGPGPHSSGPRGPAPHGSGPPGGSNSHISGSDMRNSSHWGQDIDSGRMEDNEWRPQSQGNMQNQSNYNPRPNQGGFGQQHPQGPSDPYAGSQGRGPPTQGFAFQPKPVPVQERLAPSQQRETRQHVLRAVDIVETPPARHYPQEKPITIMKDNFQGPSQYSAPPQQGNYPGQGPSPVWQMNQQQKPQYDDRRPAIDKRPEPPKQEFEKRGQFIPIGSRPISPTRTVPLTTRSYQEPNRPFPDREFSPSGRRYSPGRRFSPGRKMSPTDRRISPGRRYSPGRKMSPGRFSPRRKRSPGRISPGRKMSPGRFGPGRKMSPGRFSPGRKMSPGRFNPGRKLSPERFNPGRKMSPGRFSPGRKMSPGRFSPGRKISPGRRDDGRQLSPSKKQIFKDDRRLGRRDSPRHYSPGRQSPTRRLISPSRHRFSPSRPSNKPSDKFLDDVSVSKPIRPAYEPTQAPNQSYTGGYRDTVQYPRQESRPSPWQNEKIIFASAAKEEERRDMARRLEKPVEKSPRLSRSPIKDRYRRYSPSPRSSRSPRRSWALEKRSPEAIREPPPPPIWPGQEPLPRKPSRFHSPTQETKHTVVWEQHDEPRPFQEKIPFQDKLRVRTDLEDKFAPQRREFDDRRDYREDINHKQLDRDREFRRNDDRPEFRRDSPRRDVRDAKKVFSDIDKDFQDIYERAVEFRKKTEERQRSGDRHKAEGRYRREPTPPTQRRSRSPEHNDWTTKDRKRLFLTPTIKAKRDKAVDEIIERIFDKYDVTGDQRYRITEELRVSLSTIFIEMFSNKDVSFIELVIKYQARYPPKEEEKLIQDVLSRLPSQYRNLKRKADGGDASEISAKTPRRSPPRPSREENKRPKLADASIPEWKTDLAPPKVMSMSLSVAPAVNLAAPGMVPPPVYVPTAVEMPTNVYNQQQFQFAMGPIQQPHFSANQMQQQFAVNQQLFVDSTQQFANTQQQYAERKYGSQHISRERERRPIASRPLKRTASPSFKRSISDLKRPAISRTGRGVEIVKKPVLYGKRPLEDNKSVKKAIVQKQETVKVDKSSPKTAKVSEASAKSDEKLDAPTTEPTLDGHYELSPLLNKMVEAELQDIMKKVRELEPTNPKDDAEKLVVERFRNKTGEALRNTIGLNVTKRLLNIHNPLYVKMVFAGKPLRTKLLGFLKKYNICAFKRVGDRGGTFAAKMRTYQSFDDLCTDKNLLCGKIHVTVTPCYQFMTCPSNLKTPFDGKGTKKDTETANKDRQVEKEHVEKDTSKQQDSDKDQEVTSIKPKETQNTYVKTTSDSQINSTSKVNPVKVIPKVSPATQNKSEEKVPPGNAAANKQALKVTPAKVAENNTEAKLTSMTNPLKPVQNKPETIVTPAKVTENKPESKITSKVTPAKATDAKSQTIARATLKVTQAKVTEKEIITQETSQSSKQNITKEIPTKPTAEKETANKETDNQKTENIITKATPNNTPNVSQKPTSVHQDTTSKAIQAKTNQAQSQETVKKTPAKAVTPQGQNSATNATSVKTATQNKPNTPIATPSKQSTTNQTPVSKTVTPNKAKVTSTPKKITTAKVTPKTGNKPKALAHKSPKKKPNDFDELDDHDILALISEGIVLDECSGSDIE